MNQSAPETEPERKPKWQPLDRIERRVLGVLVEKAKTTPDAYPLTLNALTNGCNQKSNRDPQMNLEPHQVETALETLRRLGAVIEVSGGGRVSKFRHLIYEWMGVNKSEAAVMTELLLRGSQTVGELRGRAARMDPIPDVAALQPIVQSLTERGLMLQLTPAGRGQLVTHALYQPGELEKLRANLGAAPASPSNRTPATPAPSPASDTRSAPTPVSPPATSSSTGHDDTVIQAMQEEIRRLRSELDRLKEDVQDLWSNLK